MGFPDCRQIFKFPNVPHFKDGHHEIAMIAGCPGIVPEVGLDIMYARRSVNVRLTLTPFLYRGQINPDTFPLSWPGALPCDTGIFRAHKGCKGQP